MLSNVTTICQNTCLQNRKRISKSGFPLVYLIQMAAASSGEDIFLDTNTPGTEVQRKLKSLVY